MSPRESYLQTLELLRRQHAQLSEEIGELETIITGLERLAQREASSGSSNQSDSRERESHDILPPHAALGPYAEMEFIPAAEDFLQNVGIPQTTQEIADALVARGFRTRSKDFKNTAQALLKRALDAGRPLRRIGKSTWAYNEFTPSAS
jgi:hypothetical protein